MYKPSEEINMCNMGNFISFNAGDFISTTLAQLRFGVALAAIRTKNLQKVKKQARKFLRKAGRGLDDRKSINAHWLKHANIMPVLQYLSAKAEGL